MSELMAHVREVAASPHQQPACEGVTEILELSLALRLRARRVFAARSQLVALEPPAARVLTVQASAIRDTEELAYAIGFLAHHRLYKMSKGGAVSVEKAQEVAAAFMMAAEAFQADVIDKLSPPPAPAKPDRMSDLGEGAVKNPFRFV